MENKINDYVKSLGGEVVEIRVETTPSNRKKYWVITKCVICDKELERCWSYRGENFCRCNNHYLRNNGAYTYEQVKSYIESKGCKLISTEYKNNSTNLEIQCSCGNTFERSFANFKKKEAYTCRECSNTRLRSLFQTSPEDVEEYVNSLGYTLYSPYKNSSTPLTIKCQNGHTFKRDYTTLKKSNECPICKGSVGLREVVAWLTTHNIPYEQEVNVGLKSFKGTPLHFDLSVKDFNGNIVYIEYDGEYHFSPSQQESYETIRLNDSIKNLYCYHKGIKLIRVPFFKPNSLDFLLKDLLNTEVSE